MSYACWLFVDAAASFGGHEVMLLRWLNVLHQQRRVAPVLLARSNTRLYEQAAGKITTVALPESFSNKHSANVVAKLWHSIRDAYQLIKTIYQLKPELVIVAEGCLLSQAGFTLLLRLFRLPTAVYVPLVEPSKNMGFGSGVLRDWLVRRVYRHIPNAWITITPQQALHFSSWAHIATPIFCLPNTVDDAVEQADMNSLDVRRPIQVVVLGRFDAHQKGLDSLLNFLADHLELYKEMHINLVGDGPYATEITERLDNSLPLRQLLSLHPWGRAIDALRANDVLLLPSRYEGVPLVMLEAMALGVPVVASDLPGTRELLATECLFEVGDYERAIQLILASAQPEWRASITQRNREIFEARASGAAFTQAVGTLTNKLSQLSKRNIFFKSINESANG